MSLPSEPLADAKETLIAADQLKRELDLIREAANDPTLSDASVRIIAQGLSPITERDLAWEKDTIARMARQRLTIDKATGEIKQGDRVIAKAEEDRFI